MAVTIDSLDIQISSSAGSAVANIDALAESLKRLKAASGTTKVVKSLNNLKTALDGLATANLEPIKKVADAVSGLAAVQKPTGLVSAANALKKLVGVANDLDAATLDLFKQKMKELADALAPLATSLDRVGAGFARLPKNVKKAASAVGSYENAVEAATGANGGFRGSLLDVLTHIGSYIAALQQLAEWIGATVKEAKELDGIMARFARSFGEDAVGMSAEISKFNDTLGINKQEFMQYAGIFGSFARGFGISEDKVSSFSMALTQYSYDLYSSFNDIYPTFEEAARAVKSAVTGELEPIRNAGVSVSEASLKVVAANHGIAESVETMTQAQKSLLYYQAMVDAGYAQGFIGNYAAELDTAEGQIRSFTEALKTLKQSIGAAFLPIIQAVLPWVTAFVNLLSDAAMKIAYFLGYDPPDLSKMATSANSTADGMQNAATAAKALKNATMGFDELNILSPNSGAAAGGAGGQAGSNDLAEIVPEGLWSDEMLANAHSPVKALEETIKSFFKTLGENETLKEVTMLLGSFVAAWALYEPIMKAGEALKKFKDVILELKNFDIISKIHSMGTVLGGIGSSFGLVAAVVAIVAATIWVLYENWDKVVQTFKNFAENVGLTHTFEVIKESVAGFVEKLKGLRDLFEVIGAVGAIVVAAVVGVLMGAFNAIAVALPPLIDALGGLIDILAGVGSFIKGVFTGDMDLILESVKKIALGVYEFFGGMVRAVIGVVVGFVEGVIGFFVGLWDTLVGHSIVPDTILAIVDWFKSLPGRVMGFVKGFVEDVIDWFKAIPDRVVAALSSFGRRVENSFTKMWATVQQWYTTNVAPKLTLTFWVTKFSNIKDGFVSTIKNAVNAGIDLMNKFIGWLNTKLNFSWDGLTIAGKKIFDGGSIQLFTIPTIPKLEKGGVLEDGLFTMNRGEIAGKFTNGKSVVANNEMIVEGISAGVYQAVVAAMNATKGGDQAVNVYLDGRQITAAVERRQDERGRSLMGRQLGYGY